nr:hypothetical protein [Clostridioides sp.]
MILSLLSICVSGIGVLSYMQLGQNFEQYYIYFLICGLIMLAQDIVGYVSRQLRSFIPLFFYAIGYFIVGVWEGVLLGSLLNNLLFSILGIIHLLDIDIHLSNNNKEDYEETEFLYEVEYQGLSGELSILTDYIFKSSILMQKVILDSYPKADPVLYEFIKESYEHIISFNEEVRNYCIVEYFNIGVKFFNEYSYKRLMIKQCLYVLIDAGDLNITDEDVSVFENEVEKIWINEFAELLT